ncbi:MAG TPA: YajQ family cyclic di-GMP-binding protein [Candidatus Saccharimonadales bacterium]
MPTFSFDIVSDYDKAELNNVFAGTEREIGNRYDFKGTPAAIEWLDDKAGFKIIGAGQWQCDAVLDIVRKKLASRELSAKVLDLSKTPNESNLKTTWEIPFKKGLSQDLAKQISKQIRDEVPKVKPQIQGDLIRVTGSSKDDLQKVISLLKDADYDMPLQFINYR